MSYRCVISRHLLFVLLLSCQSQLTSKFGSYKDFALLLTSWHSFSLHAMLHAYAQKYVCICTIIWVYVINFLPIATFVLELCVFSGLLHLDTQTCTQMFICMQVCELMCTHWQPNALYYGTCST